MKIALTYLNGNIFDHFGHSKHFVVYDVINNKVLSEKVYDTEGSGHNQVANFLNDLGVNVLICGGIGGGAIKALESMNIKVCAGVKGDTKEALESFLNNTLVYGETANCSHHDHDHSHGSCDCHDCESKQKKLTRL